MRTPVPVATGVDSMLLDVEFTGEQTVVAVGGTTERGPSVIVRSDNGGETWATCDVSTAGRLYSVAFASPHVACAVGFNAIVHSTDAGLTWRDARVPPGSLPWFGGVAFDTSGHGFAVGGGQSPVLWQSTDGGASWTDASARLPLQAADHGLRTIAFFDDQHLFIGGTDGLVLGSDDGGLSWSARAAGEQTAWIKGVALVDGREAFAVGSHGTVLHTHDAGTTWRELPFASRDKLNIVGFHDSLHGYIGSMSGRLFATNDGGVTWSLLNEQPGRALIGAAQRPGHRDEVWFSCDDGTLLRVQRR